MGVFKWKENAKTVFGTRSNTEEGKISCTSCSQTNVIRPSRLNWKKLKGTTRPITHKTTSNSWSLWSSSSVACKQTYKGHGKWWRMIKASKNSFREGKKQTMNTWRILMPTSGSSNQMEGKHPHTLDPLNPSSPRWEYRISTIKPQNKRRRQNNNPRRNIYNLLWWMGQITAVLGLSRII